MMIAKHYMQLKSSDTHARWNPGRLMDPQFVQPVVFRDIIKIFGPFET